jgi:hypothetical protein
VAGFGSGQVTLPIVDATTSLNDFVSARVTPTLQVVKASVSVLTKVGCTSHAAAGCAERTASTIDLIIFVTGTHNAVCISAEPCVSRRHYHSRGVGNDAPECA